MRSLACLVLLGIASAVGQEATPSSLEGRPITRLEFDPSAQPLANEELDKLLPLRLGAPLKAADVGGAIQALYLTGRYRDIAIDAQPDGEGVAIRILTEFNFFVSAVNVEGEAEPPNANQLITASKLTLGVAATENDVDFARENLVERLRANGLYQASVTHNIERRPATSEALVRFNIAPGERARFDGVKLSGQFTTSPERIVSTTRWRRSFLYIPLPGWREVTENRVQTGVQRILRDLQKRDRLQGRVVLESLDYNEETNRVTPSLRIDSGPITEVTITGADISRSRLRQLIPIYQERTVDRNLLVEGRRNLLEYFQSTGYFDAEVDFRESEPAGRSVIEYSVERGERHKLAVIEISGNRYFDTQTLRERMFMLPASFLRNRNGRFSQRILEQDKEVIRDVYRSNGFRDVAVTSRVEDDYKGQHGDLLVTLQVEEGAQWRVRNLTLAGAGEDEEYLRSILQSIEGQPFSETAVAADRDTILSYYYNNGYSGASFDWSQTEPEPYRVDLRFDVSPGERQYVRGVLVNGLKSTDPELVASRLLLAPGDPVSQSRIGESQQKLYDLGIFSKVQTAVQNPDGNETNRYVIFHLNEARKYSFNFGLGAELARIGSGVITLSSPVGGAGFSPRVSLGVSRINFLGLGHTAGIQTLASNLRQRALFNYQAPQFKGQDNLSLLFSALFDNSRDVRTFSALRVEGSVQLSHRLSRANTVQYRYVFRRADLTRVNIGRELIPLLSQPNLTGMVGAAFIQDRRDDPINSRRGIYNTADVAFAAAAFGSQTDFARLLLRNTTYHRVGRDMVLARTLQFGYIQRFGGLAQIPLAERFYAGGANSHRSFPENQAGPRDLTTGFPLGGSALLFHSTELRFPLIGDNLGGVLFHDMGNVFSNVTNVSFRAVQRGVRDFDYMVHGGGFGLRYRTPIGPIRVDLSLSPNSPRFNGFVGTREELLAGRQDQVLQRLNVFQFHFSLGQTF